MKEWIVDQITGNHANLSAGMERTQLRCPRKMSVDVFHAMFTPGTTVDDDVVGYFKTFE